MAEAEPGEGTARLGLIGLGVMGRSLLASQLRSLEPPGPTEVAIAVDIAAAPVDIAEEIERRLGEV